MKATGTARKMVTDYGMTRTVGAVKLGTTENETVLGLSATNRDFSEDVAATVDAEVRALMDAAHREAWQILSRNRSVLEDLASQLLEKETLLEKDLERIFASVIKQPERPLWRADDTLVVEESVSAADFPAAAESFSRRGRKGEGTGSDDGADGRDDGTRSLDREDPASAEGDAAESREPADDDEADKAADAEAAEGRGSDGEGGDDFEDPEDSEDPAS